MEGDQVLKGFMWRDWKGDTLLQEHHSGTMSLLFSRVAPESLNNPLDLIAGFQMTGQSWACQLRRIIRILGEGIWEILIYWCTAPASHRFESLRPGIQACDVPGTLASLTQQIAFLGSVPRLGRLRAIPITVAISTAPSLRRWAEAVAENPVVFKQ